MLHRPRRYADHGCVAVALDPRPAHSHGRTAPARLADGRLELDCQAFAQQRWQMQAGLARHHAQITVGGPKEVKSSILSIDQHGGWCIRLEQQALRKIAEIRALRFKLSGHPWP